MKFFDRFDQVACINLPERVDRWKKVSKRFAKLSIPIIPRNGVKGGAKGHALARTIIYGRALVADCKKGLFVFEDDVTFRKDFRMYLSAVDEELPDDWDAIYLVWVSRHTSPYSEHLVTMRRATTLIAAGFSHRFLEAVHPLLGELGACDGAHNKVVTEAGLNIYGVVPALCGQDGSPSDISPPVDKHKAAQIFQLGDDLDPL